jgi:hypothetical protein
VISTVDPSYGAPASVPSQIGVGTDPNNTIGEIEDETYIIISLQITVSSTPDDNYDLVYYEWNNSSAVYLDWIIIGISNDNDYSDGMEYYEVFNWGNGTPDTNSNVGVVAIAEGGEDDDQYVDIADNNEVPPSADTLHDPDYDPGPPTETNGPLPQTGILIDVDENVPSNPPPGTYNFVVVISPPDGGSGTYAQVDAIQATEVPIPP